MMPRFRDQGFFNGKRMYLNDGNQTPLFSVVTVTLNPGSDLDDTIKSVMGQRFLDFELIIKDGMSRDGTESREWGDQRIKTYAKHDSGIFDAMNQALQLARGRFVNFLNAGDAFVDRQVLSDVAKIIRSHPPTPFFYGDVAKPMSRSGYELYPDRISRRFLFNNMVCHQGWFVSRETYLGYGGFETGAPYGADTRLLMKMVARDAIRYVHLRRLVARYKGRGLSTVPANRVQSDRWCQELREEIYGPVERALYSSVGCTFALMRKALSDFGLWRLFRMMQERRAANREGWTSKG